MATAVALRVSPRLRSLRAATTSWRRGYNFASTQYDAAFDRAGVPEAGTKFCSKLRADTIAYLDQFDPKTWTNDPVTTLLRGEALTGGVLEATVDAFGSENGTVVQATPEQVDAVLEHLRSYAPPQRDNRTAVRAMEAEIFDVLGGSPWPAFLVGNQALDFKKQDGVTEIEESVQANVIEQRLSDQLLADEVAGAIAIGRAPAFVGCVSNFSNFLDLCRKVLRNLELGVPVLVLSRSNTTQHTYRWAQMLVELCPKHGLDLGMVTHLAAPLSEQKRLVAAASPASPFYFTGSRPVARSIRGAHANAMASTGGPNTLVSTRLTPAVAAAVRLSASIESSGQCTALRCAVLPCSEAEVEQIMAGVPTVDSPATALREGQFAGVFGAAPFAKLDGYTLHPEGTNVAYRHSTALPPAELAEQWRNVYVDVTSPPDGVASPAFVASLAAWLVAQQPITVAVNDEDGGLELGKRVWEQTGQVVFTVGSLEQPALTCQARPQDGEIFGEFPPRRELALHTKYPVLVPTPTAAYNTTYVPAHLAAKGRGWQGSGLPAEAAALVAGVQSDEVRGYLRTIGEYLVDACSVNPKRGVGTGRTALYGLQTPPRNGQLNYVRCGARTSLDDVAPYVFPFVLTTAFDSLRISFDPDNAALKAQLDAAGLRDAAVSESGDAFAARVAAENPYNVVAPTAASEFALAGQFISLLMCVGHVKSTKPGDDEFVKAFSDSPKWLAVRK